MSTHHPTPDPTGDLRATMLARLEYGAPLGEETLPVGYAVPRRTPGPKCERCGRQPQEGMPIRETATGIVHVRWCHPESRPRSV